MPKIDDDALPSLPAGPVRLRWIEERDVDRLLAIFGDPEVVRFWSAPPLPDRAAARRLLEQIREGFRHHALYQWGVALDETDELVGTCTLAALDFAQGRAEIGFALASAAQRRGLMASALRSLLDFAFGPLGLRRIEAEADPRNAPSLRLLHRLGFVREGRMRERWQLGGELQDAVMFGLLAREWAEARSRSPGLSRKEARRGRKRG